MASPPNIPDSSVPGMLARSQPPEAWIYDRDPANGIARATFNGEVYALTISSPAAGVSAFNGRTGSVTLGLADVESAGGAPLASPAFTGVPSVPTAASGTSSTQAASCAFVAQAVQAGAGVTTFNGRAGAVQLVLGDVTSVGGAPLASPALQGSPTAPTPAVTDNSSLLATTAYVNNWGAQNTVLSFNGRRGAVTLSLADVESAGGAPIASPSFTGVPVVPTAAPGTATGQAASTAFVENAVTAGVSGVASFNTRTGAVTLTTADVVSAGGAPTVSPVLTGTPTAPTAVAGTNTGQVATCAFVETAIGSIAPIVNSFNGRNGTVTLTLGDVTGVGGAPIASPAFTGTPTVPTAAPGTNTTEAASCAFVEAAIASVAGVSSFNTRQGAVTLQGSDITGSGGALLASPAFSGTPTVPTAVAGTNTTQAASCAFVTGNFLQLIGGTLSGNLSLPALTTTNASANSVFSGGVGIAGANGLNVTGGNINATGHQIISSVAGAGAAFCCYNTTAGAACGIYTGAGNQLVIAAMNGTGGPTANWFGFQGNAMLPMAGDDTMILGISGQAWNAVSSYNFLNMSDERLKHRIEDAAPGALAAVNAIAVKNFHWKREEDEAAPRHVGWLAGDVRDVLPELAVVIEGEDEAKTLALNNAEMTAILWKAVQEVAKVVERLERSEAKLKAEVEKLKGERREHSGRARHH